MIMRLQLLINIKLILIIFDLVFSNLALYISFSSFSLFNSSIFKLACSLSILFSIGLVSIFCSNLAGGFPAGYDKTGSRYNGRIKHCKADLPLLKDVKFICKDYHYLSNFNNCVIYIDPPYAKKHQYNYEIFNTQEFWKFSREISKNNYVFISEQEAPNDFQSIWSITSERNMRGKTSILTENLYTYTQGLTKI